MLVISDSPTFLLEKCSKNINIEIENIITLSPECKNLILKKYDTCLLLISESFYNFFEYIEKDKESLNIEINKTLEIINELIEYLTDMGTQVYVPLIPKHFLYSDSIKSSFLDYESKDIFIQKINHKLFDKYNHLPSITFLIGIEDLNWEISKDYFRFSSIYNKKNSLKILNQIKEHEKVINKKKKKLIIIDLDNTIWRGTIGDDSIDGINIDSSDPVGSVYRYIQNILLVFKNKGFLLAISSKNNEELALKALFEKNKSIFKKSDIVSYRINWNSKSNNIKEICNELDISLTETIFIDDSDHECDEVRTNCKGISIFKVPKNIYKYPYLLANSELFDINFISEEDKLRTKMYKDNIKRKKLLKNSNDNKDSKDEWISTLNLKLETEIITLKNKKISRIIQLFNRTNQFNLSGNKYSPSTFNNIINNTNCIYYYGTASDRIGDQGLISALGYEFTEKEILITDFILSCRMFGKYIEELMLLPVLNIAILKNCNIKFDYTENGRNKLIGEFLSKIADKKLCLSLDRINSLKNKFSMLPVKIIEKKS